MAIKQQVQPEGRRENFAQRTANVSYGFYDRIRHREASRIAEGEATATNFDHLRGHKYALLASYRRSGEAVPTPVWFGVADDGRLYFRTEERAAKVKRIRANPRVRVAPCTMRGKLRGPAAEGLARVVSAEEEERAEAAIQANYGLGRRLYEIPQEPLGLAGCYVEVTPLGAGQE